MSDKGSVWMDSYEELDEIVRLFKEKKISLQEFSKRTSVIDKRMKAATKEVKDIIDLGELDIEDFGDNDGASTR